MKSRGGDVVFSKPDSSLHFTDTFEESIQELLGADERSTLSNHLTRLDVILRQDRSAVIQQHRVSEIIPLCDIGINDNSLFFIPDVENKKIYLLCVGLKSKIL